MTGPGWTTLCALACMAIGCGDAPVRDRLMEGDRKTGCAADPLGGCQKPLEPFDQTSSSLIGGTVASEGAYPSTLHIWGNCTAAKVGPRAILTAAHCISQFDTLEPTYGPRSTIWVTNRKTVDSQSPLEGGAYVPVVVERIFQHPSWLTAIGTSRMVLGPYPSADVAIIILTTESAKRIKDIPTAVVDTSSVMPNDPLVVMGYGCELGVYGPVDYSRVRLKIQPTNAISVKEALAPGREPSPDLGDRVADNYLFTPGFMSGARAASACPGDSGGPVYRNDGTEQMIVGVNAYYNFFPQNVDPAQVSLSNWHTRLDFSAGSGAGSWISGILRSADLPTPDPLALSCVDDSACGGYLCNRLHGRCDFIATCESNFDCNPSSACRNGSCGPI